MENDYCFFVFFLCGYGFVYYVFFKGAGVANGYRFAAFWNMGTVGAVKSIFFGKYIVIYSFWMLFSDCVEEDEKSVFSAFGGRCYQRVNRIVTVCYKTGILSD